MSSLSKELVFLVLQFLDEEKYRETMHKLEKESGFFFNMKYFEELVTKGHWEKVEEYLSGFTKIDQNRYSMKIFFEIRKQKYLEALDKRDHAKAVEILKKELKLYAAYNENLFKEIANLLTLENFRENEQLSRYVDAKTARASMLVELKKLLEANPHFRDKLQFPTFRNSRLRTLINQSLNWQHQLCRFPKLNPEIRTLFVDHSCAQSSSVTNTLVASHVPKVGPFPAGAHIPFQLTPATVASLGWTTASGPSSLPHQSVSGGPLSLAPPSNAGSMQKRPRSSPADNSAMDHQIADSDHILKITRPFRISEEVHHLPLGVPISYPGQSHVRAAYSSADLPENVVANLSQGSAVKSMDFHPLQQTLLLVGTNIGDVALWEVSTRERLANRNFKIWDLGSCSITLQATLSNEYSSSVNRVIWSPDGSLFGVAYSKHVVHLYSYHGGNDLRNHFEVEAHAGNVNDIAFSSTTKKLYVVTCGEDKLVKVWDAANGSKQYTFEGHEAAVYSVCPHYKENIQFVFSTAVDGKIKAWLYDNMGARVQFEAPGRSCTTMAYIADGTRLFSCGTNKEGESYLVEWNDIECAVKHKYSGLGKHSVGVVQFDTIKNRFLAAGDEFVVKIWDMDEVNVIKTIDAAGGLPASPCIRFNKEGTFLAISTSDNGVKILANAKGTQMMHVIEIPVLDPSQIASSSAAKGPIIATFGASSSNAGTNITIADGNAPVTAVVALDEDNQSLTELKPRMVEDLEKLKNWKLTEMNDLSQLRSLRLPDTLLCAGIVRLTYNHSGSALLALANNAVHKLWKWQRHEGNLTGEATTKVPPRFWQSACGIIMTNDISEANAEEAVPCFALSRNDSYIISASGGKISLFNMVTFKTMTEFMSPPPAATSLAFVPQDNNVVAVGMEDGSIQIYNVRADELKGNPRGHQKKVTGLAFSNVLNVLVSSGADAQVCVWCINAWERKANKFLQLPPGRMFNPQAHTRVQFHRDQTHVLVVHEIQIAIYEAPTLDCVKQWVLPQESGVAIADATYSCDGRSVYACLSDGSVYVLTADGLKLRCRINVTAYLPFAPGIRPTPVVIAAHPTEPTQFALGLTNGCVFLLEPLEAEGKWGDAPPPDASSAASSSITPVSVGADQAPA